MKLEGGASLVAVTVIIVGVASAPAGTVTSIEPIVSVAPSGPTMRCTDWPGRGISGGGPESAAAVPPSSSSRV